MLYIITTTKSGGSCSCSEYEIDDVLMYVLEHEDKKIDLQSLRNEYIDYLTLFKNNKKNKNAFLQLKEWLKKKKGFKEPKYTHINSSDLEYL